MKIFLLLSTQYRIEEDGGQQSTRSVSGTAINGGCRLLLMIWRRCWCYIVGRSASSRQRTSSGSTITWTHIVSIMEQSQITSNNTTRRQFYCTYYISVIFGWYLYLPPMSETIPPQSQKRLCRPPHTTHYNDATDIRTRIINRNPVRLFAPQYTRHRQKIVSRPHGNQVRWEADCRRDTCL